MSEAWMYSWKLKRVAVGIVVTLFFVLDRWVARYATVVQEGNLQRVVCIGEVIDVNSGDVVRFGDGSVKVGRVVSSDMEGNLEFRDGAGKLLVLRRGTRPDEVSHIEEDQDQVLTVRLLTWPRSLRKQGVDFRGTTVVVGNVFPGRPFSDRVLKIGDRLFVSAPLKRLDRLDRVELNEYYRNPFLLRLTGLFVGVTLLVGGFKGLLTIVALGVSLLFMFAVYIPSLLGEIAKAASWGAWFGGGFVLAMGGVGFLQRRLIEKRDEPFPLRIWMGGVLMGAVSLWATIQGIGHRPVPLALFTAFVVTLATFVVMTGWSFKVISGSLGVLGGLAVCAAISLVASRLLSFTGLAIELGFLELGTVLFRQPETHLWPFRDYLTAGLIVAAVGAMMDVSMSVSSTVYEVKRANPSISPLRAMKAGYNVGKDIMSTMTDTLLFAFVGADLVLIVMPGLIFPEGGRLYPFLRMMNEEEFAVEAIHALMGTLGLVLAIPISAFIAGWLTAYYRGPAFEATSTAGEAD